MVIIRQYKNGDWNQVISLMVEFGAYIEEIDQLKRADYKENSAKYFTENMLSKASKFKGKTFVALENKNIIGFISGHISKLGKEEKMETINQKPGIVDEFFITKSKRSKGIGNKLFEQLEKYFKSQSCDIIRIEVFAPNTIARTFYQNNGYIERSITVSKII